jgi:nitronate monooxygenase
MHLKNGFSNSDETVAVAADGTPIQRFSSRMPTRHMTGDIAAMALYAGQSVGFCKRIQPAAEIVSELATEAAHFSSRTR